MKFRCIEEKDLKEFWKIANNYLNEREFNKIKGKFERFKELYVGCYQNSELLGIAYGSKKGKEATLEGIAVIKEYWRRKLGSNLLKFFEDQARKLGCKRIGVGSADIEWVERFYLKNNYKPTAILLLFKSKDKQEVLKKGYIKTEVYDTKERQKLKRDSHADKAVYIMEKDLNKIK